MARYNVVETTKVRGSCYDFIYAADVENGTLLAKGDIKTGERNVYNATLPTATSEVFLVANPAWKYDDAKAEDKNEDAYIVPANTIFRVYGLLEDTHDKFAVMNYGIIKNDSADPAVGDYVVADTDTGKVKDVGTTEPDGTTVGFYGKITEIENYGFPFMVTATQTVDTTSQKVVIEVIQNKNI